MNKLYTTLVVLFLCSFAVAQNYNIKPGFRTGLNYSSLSGDDIDDLENRYGFHASFFVDFKISDRFALSPELGISALGANESPLALANGDNVDLKTNWLQVSVLAKYNLGEKLFLELGPQVGVNVTENDNNDYYDYDVLAVGGIGYHFNRHFSVDVRYGYGLSNIFDGALADTTEANNRYFQLGVAYRL